MPNFTANSVISSFPVHKFPNKPKVGNKLLFSDYKYGSNIYGISCSIIA